jgi:REP element-mobilizing transposase RayT
MSDHVHMLIRIPPKLAVSSVAGYLKGKSAIHVARHALRKQRNLSRCSLWARGLFCGYHGQVPGKDPQVYPGAYNGPFSLRVSCISRCC